MLTSNETVILHQQQLLAAMQEFFVRRDQVISDSVRQAFLATPRHLFVDSYKTFAASDWHEVNSDNIGGHLAVLYRDEGLGIFDDGVRVSTISRPAFALYMLQMLNLERGMRVFEIGAGSGWNAALIGRLVGPEGFVESVEVIPELAARAQQSVSRAGLSNVRIRCADGADNSDGRDGQGLFDRVVFTTGAYDLPAIVHGKIREGGLLQFILKCPGGGDVLLLLRRQLNSLVALDSMPCEFVPMTGQGRREENEPMPTENLLNKTGLREKLVFARSYSYGGRHANNFIERTFPIRSFLAATEPNFRPLLDPECGSAFAILSESNDWLIIARNRQAVCYGTSTGWDYFMHLMHRWVDLGMPTMLSMDLGAYLSGQVPTVLGERQWLMRRRETDFVWSV